MPAKKHMLLAKGCRHQTFYRCRTTHWHDLVVEGHEDASRYPEQTLAVNANESLELGYFTALKCSMFYKLSSSLLVL